MEVSRKKKSAVPAIDIAAIRNNYFSILTFTLRHFLKAKKINNNVNINKIQLDTTQHH